MRVLFNNCISCTCSSARLDFEVRRDPLPDFLFGRPSSIREPLLQAEQAASFVHFVQPANQGDLLFFVLCHALWWWRQRLCNPTLSIFHADHSIFSVNVSDDDLRKYFNACVFHGSFSRGMLFEFFKDFLWTFHPVYCVNLASGTCSCQHFVLTQMPCMHLFAALKKAGRKLSDLPSCKTNPWLNIDYAVSCSADHAV